VVVIWRLDVFKKCNCVCCVWGVAYEDWSFDLGLEQIWMLINPCLIIKRVKEFGNDQEGNTFKGNTIEGKAGW